MGQKHVNIHIHLPAMIKRVIEIRAKENRRSRNAEIVFRLEDSIAKDGDVRLMKLFQYALEQEYLRQKGIIQSRHSKR